MCYITINTNNYHIYLNIEMFSLIKLDVQFLKRKSVEQQKNNVHFPLVGSLNHIYILYYRIWELNLVNNIITQYWGLHAYRKKIEVFAWKSRVLVEKWYGRTIISPKRWSQSRRRWENFIIVHTSINLIAG